MAAFTEHATAFKSKIDDPVPSLERFGPEVKEALEAWVRTISGDLTLCQKMGTKWMAAFLREHGYPATYNQVRRWREQRYPDARFRS